MSLRMKIPEARRLVTIPLGCGAACALRLHRELMRIASPDRPSWCRSSGRSLRGRRRRAASARLAWSTRADFGRGDDVFVMVAPR